MKEEEKNEERRRKRRMTKSLNVTTTIHICQILNTSRFVLYPVPLLIQTSFLEKNLMIRKVN